MTTNRYVWREVSMERPFTEDTIHDILIHLASLTSRGPVVWEVVSQGGTIRYRLGTLQWSAGKLREVFSAHSKVQFADVEERTPMTSVRSIRLTRNGMSLNTDISATFIRATLTAMVNASADHECVLQVILGKAHQPKLLPRHVASPSSNWIESVLGSVAYATTTERSAIQKRAEQHSFEACIRIGTTGEYANARLNNILSAIRTLESAGVKMKASHCSADDLNRMALPFVMPLRLSVAETAALMCLPAGEEELPGTPGLHPKTVLTPKWYKEPSVKGDRTIAMSLDQTPQKLSIPIKDALEHTVLLGGTGSGKSTVMLNQIIHDIDAGRSVLCLDPKSDLITDILARIPEHRKDDVVVIDPSDVSPVGFNPLSYNQDPNLTADTILAVFRELWSDSWGVYLQDVLGAALNTLARVKGATLLWLIPLLTDDEFRKGVLTQIHDPIGLESFWKQYDVMSTRERNNVIAPALNRLRQISTRPALRNVLGQANPKFSLTELFYSRKIVLVPLNRGLVGADTARMLGSLIVGLTWNLALSRAKIPPEKRHTVCCYIDELQDYLALPTSFSDALSQARGMGVAYTVAHQYRGQLSPDIKAGIDANCKSKICFNLAGDDAKDMARFATNLSHEDFMTLPRYEIYTTMQVGGRSTGWISGKTLPPREPVRLAAELKAASMDRYGVPASETEKQLTDLIVKAPPEPDPVVTETPIGRRKKT